MNVILITVLLTLLGIGLVVLLVWLSVVSSKSVKHRKMTDEIHKDMWDNSENMSEENRTAVDEIRKDFTDSVDEIYSRIDILQENLGEYVTKIYNDFDSKFVDVYLTISNNDKEQHSKSDANMRDIYDDVKVRSQKFENFKSTIDSRFDKLYLALDDIKKNEKNKKNK